MSEHTCPLCGTTWAGTEERCPGCQGEPSETKVLVDVERRLRQSLQELDRLRDGLTRSLSDLERIKPLPGLDAAAPRSVDLPKEERAYVEPQLSEQDDAEPTLPSQQPADDGTSKGDSHPPAVTPQTHRVNPVVKPAKPDHEREVRFGQKWLMIAGMVVLLFGVVYFLKYAFDQNWVGPAGRVAAAYLWGIGFLIGGDRARRRWRPFGLYLIGGGLAVFYLATFSAFSLYTLIGQELSFGIMLLTTLLAGTLAIVYDSKWLAVLGLVGGFATPLLLSTGQANQTFLMAYMVLLNLAVVAVVAFKRWRLLSYFGFLLTWVLFSAWTFEHYQESRFWPTMIFLNLFYLIYILVPMLHVLADDAQGRVRGFLLAFPNSFLAFGFSYAFISEAFSVEAVSIPTVLYAGMFLALAQFAYRRDPDNQRLLVLMLAKASMFLLLAVPLLVSKHWITVFWQAETAVLFWLAWRFESRKVYLYAMLLLGVAVGKFFLYDYLEVFELTDATFRKGYGYLLFERWLTTAFVVGNLLLTARQLGRCPENLIPWRDGTRRFLLVAFGLFLFFCLNMEVSGLFHDVAPNATQAALSVLWALFASGLMVLGFLRQAKNLRITALILFCLTAAKVFFVDMVEFSTPFRIVSFLGLGVLMVLASFLYNRLGESLLPNQTDSKEEIR